MMSERTPKQPLNDSEYTVPEYSVLLPPAGAGNDAAENVAGPNSAAPHGTADNNGAKDNAPGINGHSAVGQRETTAGYAAPIAFKQTALKRPMALYIATWCVAVIIVLSLFSSIRVLQIIAEMPASSGEMSYYTVLIVGIALVFSLLKVFFLWKIWGGREWARIIALVYCAYEVFIGVSNAAQIFTNSDYFSSAQDVAAYPMLGIVSNIFTTGLYALIFVLLMQRSVGAYMGAVSDAQMYDRQQRIIANRMAGQNPPTPQERFNEGGQRLN